MTVLKTLDRYIIREALTPFLLALGVFTFLLAISPMLNHAKDLLSKGVDLPTVGFLLLTLLPQSLGVTIPMAFLAGLLMALGRLSGVTMAIPADTVFGDGNILVTRGTAEKKIPDLLKTSRGAPQGVPVHREIMQRHQMFSFPVACLVFALLAVSLGMHTRREGKMGGFTLGLAVILVYYAVMAIFEGRAKSRTFPAEYARWAPNVVLGVVGVAALWWRMKSGGSHVSIRVPAVLRTPPWRYFRRSARPAAAAAGSRGAWSW